MTRRLTDRAAAFALSLLVTLSLFAAIDRMAATGNPDAAVWAVAAAAAERG
ncbi:MAG: hypothetical protein LCI02_23305 [Proteobacteria bacterium]|nr:hypothetical protein [Pseudomonadota bacterium]